MMSSKNQNKAFPAAAERRTCDHTGGGLLPGQPDGPSGGSDSARSASAAIRVCVLPRSKRSERQRTNKNKRCPGRAESRQVRKPRPREANCQGHKGPSLTVPRPVLLALQQTQPRRLGGTLRDIRLKSHLLGATLSFSSEFSQSLVPWVICRRKIFPHPDNIRKA